MNFLLRDLKEAGTMTCDCIAFADATRCEHIMERFEGRAIFHMGEGVSPGPFWAVHACDVEALVTAGYTQVIAPKPPT